MDTAEFQEPAAMQVLVSLVKKQGKSGYFGLSIPRSVSLRAHNFANVSGIAAYSDIPFSKVVNECLEAAIEELFEKIGPDEEREIRRLGGQALHQDMQKRGRVDSPELQRQLEEGI